MFVLIPLTAMSGYAAALMLDLIAMLLAVRALCIWRPITLLCEFDRAGKPLVDRTLHLSVRLWERLCPARTLNDNGQLLVAWGVICVIRLGVTLFLNAMA